MMKEMNKIRAFIKPESYKFAHHSLHHHLSIYRTWTPSTTNLFDTKHTEGYYAT